MSQRYQRHARRSRWPQTTAPMTPSATANAIATG